MSVFGPNAGEPKPERWLDPSPESISQKLLIFGGPSRSYPGQNLAMFVVAKTLVRLFGECEVGSEREEKAKLVVFLRICGVFW